LSLSAEFLLESLEEVEVEDSSVTVLSLGRIISCGPELNTGPQR
jgi:hypothetical protein